MRKSLLALTLIAAPLAFAQNNGGIGDGFYTSGVDYAGFNIVQRGDNPSAIVQLEVQPEGTDSVFTTGETLRVVTQAGSPLANAVAARLPEAVTLAEGETLTLSFKYRYVPPLLFGTENQDIYITRSGLFYDTNGGDLIPAYKAEDADWAGYYGIIWMDDSVNADYDPPRQHILKSVSPGSAGSPLNKGSNIDDSGSSTSFIADEDALYSSFSVSKTAEGLVITNEIGKVSASTPAVLLTTVDTNALDAVDTFDTITWTFQGFVEVIISDFKVELTSDTSSWYGYDVLETNDVNTGTWLGWVWIENDPWIWSYSLEKYVYMKDDSGWVFVRK